MLYNIGEVAKKMNLTISTLRYYDKEGLLPNVKRDQAGIRKFDEGDIEGIKIIACLKDSGMQIKDIKRFMDLCMLGDKSLKERLEIFESQEVNIENQIKALKETLDIIKYKKWYYNTAIANKSEKKVRDMDISKMPKEIQKLYKKLKD